MKELLLAVTLCAATATTARADEWTALDYGLQSSFVTLLAADYLQTRQIVASGRESNPVMGRNGERVPPEMYFLSVAATHTLAMIALPKKLRRIAMGFSIGAQVNSVTTNYVTGYTLTW